MNRLRAARPSAIGAAVLALLLALVCGAQAHPILQNPMWVEVAPDMIRVKLMVSVRELGVVQGLPINPDGSVDLEEAKDTAPRHTQYVLDHLHFRADGLPIGGKVTAIEPPAGIGVGAEAPDMAHFAYRLEYPLAAPPAVVALRQTMCVEFPSAPGVPWDLSYAYRFGAPEQTPRQFGALPREVEISYQTGFVRASPGAQASGGAKADENEFAAGLRYFGGKAAGWWLFLAALALNAASNRDGVRQFGLAAAGFGAGYAVSAFGWLRPPAWIFPAPGGAGIILVALDNIYRPGQRADRRRLVMAAAFPVVQGLAAAAALPGKVSGLAVWMAGLGLFSVIAPLRAGLPRRMRSPERFLPFWQMVSLCAALGGVWFLLSEMGVRPRWLP